METPSRDRSTSVQARSNARQRGKPVPSRQRSRITNGRLLPGDMDQRSAWVRRAKDVIASHLSDLGGEDNTSAAERSLVRRASILTVELERLEAQFAAAGAARPEDLDLYIRGSGNLRRLLESVGLQRRAKEIGKFIDGKMTDPPSMPSEFRMIDEVPA